LKGAPTIRSGSNWQPEVVPSDQATPIWQPRSKGRPKRGMAR
jgi:hypothetical protein